MTLKKTNEYYSSLLTWALFFISLTSFSVLSFLLLLGSRDGLIIIVELVIVLLVILFFYRRINSYKKADLKYFEVACCIIITASLVRSLFMLTTYFECLYRLSDSLFFFVNNIASFAIIPVVILVILQKNGRRQEKLMLGFSALIITINNYLISFVAP